MNLSRQESAQLTRQNIIKAAYDIVGEQGYEALTTNALISEAGVAKGTLYHHFNNLDEVIFAMIEMLLEQTLDDVPVEEFDTMEKYLDACGQFIMNDFTQDPKLMNALYGFLPKGMKDPFFKSVARSLIERACSRIIPAIQKFYAGQIAEEKIDHAIRMIDIFTAGFCIHFVILEEQEKYQKIWIEFSDMLQLYLEE